MQTLGIIGFGNFGQFMAKHLKPFFDITVYDQKNIKKNAAQLGIKTAPLQKVAEQNIVIIAVPVQVFKSVLIKIKKHVKHGTLILDVGSVKTKPIELMKKHLPPSVEIIGAHPLFGPQSGKNGIKGLKIVVCPVRTKPATLSKFKKILTQTLKLKVITKSPKEHDQAMAYVQALTFFIGKAMSNLKIPDTKLNTPTYEHLVYLKKIVETDSGELFLTIQNENPFAKKVRKDLISKLMKIDQKLN